jgi:hypothetical protein
MRHYVVRLEGVPGSTLLLMGQQPMLIADAQREVRNTYLGGSVGQAVSAAIWAIAAGVSTWHSHRWGMAALVIGGLFIFPLTTVVLRLFGGRTGLGRNNPFRALAMQVAFVLPLSMPLLVLAVAFRPGWFYPGAMILVGAHYLPFATLYGQKSFLALGGLLVVLGVCIAMYMPNAIATGGWVTALVLIVFAVVERVEARRAAERSRWTTSEE